MVSIHCILQISYFWVLNCLTLDIRLLVLWCVIWIVSFLLCTNMSWIITFFNQVRSWFATCWFLIFRVVPLLHVLLNFSRFVDFLLVMEDSSFASYCTRYWIRTVVGLSAMFIDYLVFASFNCICQQFQIGVLSRRLKLLRHKTKCNRRKTCWKDFLLTLWVGKVCSNFDVIVCRFIMDSLSTLYERRCLWTRIQSSLLNNILTCWVLVTICVSLLNSQRLTLLHHWFILYLWRLYRSSLCGHLFWSLILYHRKMKLTRILWLLDGVV